MALAGCAHVSRGNRRFCVSSPAYLPFRDAANVTCSDNTCCRTRAPDQPAEGRRILRFRVRLLGSENVSPDDFRELVRQQFQLPANARIIVVVRDGLGLRRDDTTMATTAEVLIEVDQADAVETETAVNYGLQDQAAMAVIASAINPQVTGAQASTQAWGMEDEQDDGLSGGQIAGLAVGLACAALLIVVVAAFAIIRSQRKPQPQTSRGPATNPVYSVTTDASSEV